MKKVTIILCLLSIITLGGCITTQAQMDDKQSHKAQHTQKQQSSGFNTGVGIGFMAY